jgi:hypothetical protein
VPVALNSLQKHQSTSHMPCFSLSFSANSILRVHPTRDQEDRSQRVLNQNIREDEDMIHHPVWLNTLN